MDWDDFAAAAALAELIADDEAERLRLEADQQDDTELSPDENKY